MSSDTKFSPEHHESSEFEDNERNAGPSRLLEAVRLGLTVIGFFIAIVIVGTSANNLQIYNQTHLSEEFQLPLWPFDFNLGPTIALVACGAIMMGSSITSLLVSKVPSVSFPVILSSFNADPSASLQSFDSYIFHSWLCLCRDRRSRRRDVLLLRHQCFCLRGHNPELVLSLGGC